jgi:hypothetical protein
MVYANRIDILVYWISLSVFIVLTILMKLISDFGVIGKLIDLGWENLPHTHKNPHNKYKNLL